MKNRKEIFFLLITFFISVLLLEFGIGIIFYFKDSTEMIHSKEVIDSPYLYYSQKKLQYELNKFDSANKNIVIIGGSVADQFGEFKILDSILKRQNIKNINIINAAIDGYVLEQEFIQIQTIIQHYKPYLVIGINGYNDLISYKLNRYDFNNYSIPPQNYRLFKVISEGKFKKSFISRFSYLFKNITRAIVFVKRIINNQSSYDYSKVSEKEITEFVKLYGQTQKDLKDFCEMRNIIFIDFLQPIKFFYPKKKTQDYEKVLSEIYFEIESKFYNSDKNCTITKVLGTDISVYLDDCHLNKKGNKLLGEEIYQNIKKYLN